MGCSLVPGWFPFSSSCDALMGFFCVLSLDLSLSAVCTLALTASWQVFCLPVCAAISKLSHWHTPGDASVLFCLVGMLQCTWEPSATLYYCACFSCVFQYSYLHSHGARTRYTCCSAHKLLFSFTLPQLEETPPKWQYWQQQAVITLPLLRTNSYKFAWSCSSVQL